MIRIDTMMQDSTKITVLMIYYEYWGREEIRRRRIIQGINKVTRIFRYLIKNAIDADLYDEYIFWTMPWFWVNFANLLLQGFGPPYERVRIKNPEQRLAEHVGMRWLDIYHRGLSVEELQNIDSIVCLF